MKKITQHKTKPKLSAGHNEKLFWNSVSPLNFNYVRNVVEVKTILIKGEETRILKQKVTKLDQFESVVEDKDLPQALL